MKPLTKTLLIVLWCVAIGAGYFFGRRVPFSEQWPLYEALRTTSAIIFAVVGAWLAIVYPERLRLSISEASGDPKGNGQRHIGVLLSPAVNSTAVLCIVLMVGVLAPLLKRTDLLLAHVDEFRGASYALLVGLTLWQAWTVILTLIPADLILSRANQEGLRNETLRGLRKTSIQSRKQDSGPA